MYCLNATKLKTSSLILENVSSSRSCSPKKRRLMHNRSRSVQRYRSFNQHIYIYWKILYSMMFKQSISYRPSLLWFCPDRDHRKGVIKIRLRVVSYFSFKTYGRGKRPIRLQNSPYFCLFKYVRASSQTRLKTESETGERRWKFFLSPHTPYAS